LGIREVMANVFFNVIMSVAIFYVVFLGLAGGSLDEYLYEKDISQKEKQKAARKIVIYLFWPITFLYIIGRYAFDRAWPTIKESKILFSWLGLLGNIFKDAFRKS
jgi:uncharacterized membrane protein